MSWCPKCRTEYRPHIARCADCDSKLVAELPPEPVKAAPEEVEQVQLCSVLGETHAALIVNALREEGIPCRTQFGGIPELAYPGAIPNLVVGIFVNGRDEARARRVYESHEGAPG